MWNLKLIYSTIIKICTLKVGCGILNKLQLSVLYTSILPNYIYNMQVLYIQLTTKFFKKHLFSLHLIYMYIVINATIAVFCEKYPFNFVNSSIITSYFKFPFLKHSYCSQILFFPRLVWNNTRTIWSLFYIPQDITMSENLIF